MYNIVENIYTICSNVDIILSIDVILWFHPHNPFYFQNYPQLRYSIVENIHTICNNVDIIQNYPQLNYNIVENIHTICSNVDIILSIDVILWMYPHNPLYFQNYPQL